MKDGGARKSSNQAICVTRNKDSGHKPVREESYSSRLFFKSNDFSYVDAIVDPERENRTGPKGYAPSSIFMALLFMYLKGMGSILELVRFLCSNPEWLQVLGLRRSVHGRMLYRVPDRSTFYKFAGRLGVEGMTEVFARTVVQLVRMGVITGEKVSLDCSIIWAWFKDCRFAKRPGHGKQCRRHRTRDREASWTWDDHGESYIYGYKVHIAIDTSSGLPIMLTVTRAGFGENRTVAWFLRMFLKLKLHVKEFLADAAYDANRTRLLVIKKLRAIPLIALNPRNCEGDTEEEKRARCKELRQKFYAKNFLKSWWIDPDSELFDKEFDARTFSEQAFSVGKGSLNLDSLKHRGVAWATLHAVCICTVMLGVAKTAIDIGRPDLARCIRCFQA